MTDTYIKTIKEQRTWIEKEVKDVRNFINDHLDRIQEKLMKELGVFEVITF
jgi:ribosome assembly protein YihI (activator of Der GTPase)